MTIQANGSGGAAGPHGVSREVWRESRSWESYGWEKRWRELGLGNSNQDETRAGWQPQVFISPVPHPPSWKQARGPSASRCEESGQPGEVGMASSGCWPPSWRTELACARGFFRFLPRVPGNSPNQVPTAERTIAPRMKKPASRCTVSVPARLTKQVLTTPGVGRIMNLSYPSHRMPRAGWRNWQTRQPEGRVERIVGLCAAW